MKPRILTFLRNVNVAVSGAVLSAELGISRVSIWKHIRRLQESGYEIESSPKGYRLIKDPDTPFAWEFPGRSHRIHYYPQVSSTMDIALEMARKGCLSGSVVVADRQAQGRGRLQRIWRSADGGLYFTLVLRPEMPPALSARVSFAASLHLAQTLCRLYGVEARVKWPNDILVDEKKIAGMLSQMEAEADRVVFLNVGIGLNVNNDPSRQEPAATSLKRLLGHPVSRKQILAEFLDAFEPQLNDKALSAVIDQWKTHTVTLNRMVKIVTVRETLCGLARDIDPAGGLILELADGSLQTVIYGDCFHQ
jgi:BirA family biotin operon repressor/biotin-[acetyl-CoA-carboxylase] ligase